MYFDLYASDTSNILNRAWGKMEDNTVQIFWDGWQATRSLEKIWRLREKRNASLSRIIIIFYLDDLEKVLEKV